MEPDSAGWPVALLGYYDFGFVAQIGDLLAPDRVFLDVLDGRLALVVLAPVNKRLLVAPPPPAPVVLDRFEVAVTRPFQERRQLFWRQRCEQFGGETLCERENLDLGRI